MPHSTPHSQALPVFLLLCAGRRCGLPAALRVRWAARASASGTALQAVHGVAALTSTAVIPAPRMPPQHDSDRLGHRTRAPTVRPPRSACRCLAGVKNPRAPELRPLPPCLCQQEAAKMVRYAAAVENESKSAKVRGGRGRRSPGPRPGTVVARTQQYRLDGSSKQLLEGRSGAGCPGSRRLLHHQQGLLRAGGSRLRARPETA